MRKSAVFGVTALSAAIALSAHAGPLGGLGGVSGGLGGGLGGGVGAGLGGLSGSLNGSLNGAGPDLPPVQRQARPPVVPAAKPIVGGAVNAPAAIQVLPSAQGAVGAAVGAVAGDVRTVEVAPRLVVAPPVVGLPSVQAGVIRERQSAALIGGGVTILSAPDSVIYMDRQAEQLRGQLAGTGVKVRREGETIVLQMPSDVTFAFDKSDIRPRFYPALEAVAATLNDYPATYVDVIGHTDAIGSAPYNQRLSERRAQSVASFIQRREEIPARLYAAGRGKFEPIASNATIDGRAANRRVEILLHPYRRG